MSKDKTFISMEKEYETEHGLPVRLYSVVGNVEKRVHGATLETGGWHFRCWYENGKSNYMKRYDLKEKKKTIKRYAVYYRTDEDDRDYFGIFAERPKNGDEWIDIQIIDVVEVEFEV